MQVKKYPASVEIHCFSDFNKRDKKYYFEYKKWEKYRLIENYVLKYTEYIGF